MDITKILESDHRRVEDLFANIDKAEGADRRPLIEELVTALNAHMALEEDVLYPAMKPVVGAEAVEEGVTEHELARKTLAEMLALAPDEPGFGAAMESVKAGIEHHVEEEEGDVFPKLRSDGQQALDDMATRFLHKRVALGMSTHAASIAAASTKDELVAEASAAGVEGASSMNKDQLAEAVAQRMG